MKNDIATIAAKNQVVSWEWYKQGYGPEPFDGKAINENNASLQTHQGVFHDQAAPQHASYIVHHNGPQTTLGGSDDDTMMGDLREAFDDDRLTGKAAPLPASYAAIDPAKITALPHYVSADTSACQALGITPTDYTHGYAVGAESDPPPQDSIRVRPQAPATRI